MGEDSRGMNIFRRHRCGAGTIVPKIFLYAKERNKGVGSTVIFSIT